MNNIGERLKYILEKKGISSYRLAVDLNIGKSTITNYLTNSTKPDSSKLDVICTYLNIKKQWLLTGEGEIYNDTKDYIVRKELKETDIETVKELIEAIKRRDEHVEALIRISEKHADNFAELLNQMKKTTTHPNKDAACTDTSELAEE